jgi:hypothetical protein
MSHRITLDISRVGRASYRFSLAESSSTEPRIAVYTAEFNPLDVETIMREIAANVDVARSSLAPHILENSRTYLQTQGQALWNCLFRGPEDGALQQICSALGKNQGSLLLRADDTDISWELLNNGDLPLGLRFDMGRTINARLMAAQRHAPHRSLSSPGPEKRRRALIVANPNEGEEEWDLPRAAEEGVWLRDFLRAHDVDCEDYLPGECATREAVRHKLSSHDYDLIHYAGHVVQHGRRLAFRLRDGALFPAPDVHKTVRGTPVVFLNACRSGEVNGTEKSEHSETLTDAFLHAGAHMVVGSLLSPTDTGSLGFAESFYGSILNGTTAGEAMRTARRAIFEKDSCAASWACFVMYGDPAFAPFRSGSGTALFDPAATGLCHRVGPLTAGDCEPSVWTILLRSVDLALRSGGSRVRTGHLYEAMRTDPAGLLARALVRFTAPARGEAHRAVRPAPGEVSCSEDVSTILLRAQATAAPVGERALLRAFIAKGGGKRGELLRKGGIHPESLLSELYDVDGGLRLDEAFDTVAADAIRRAMQAAAQKGRDRWDGLDLLYGILTGPDAAFPGLLRAAGKAVDILTGLLRARLAVGLKTTGDSGTKALHIKPRMQRVLCLAEEDAEVRNGNRIGELHLLRGLDNDGGAACEFLLREGIQLSVIIRTLSATSARAV